MNGSAVANTSGYPPTMLPQGIELDIQTNECSMLLFCSETPVSVWGQPAATPANLCK